MEKCMLFTGLKCFTDEYERFNVNVTSCALYLRIFMNDFYEIQTGGVKK